MHIVRMEGLNDFAEWRGKARQVLAAGLSPDQVEWRMLGDVGGLLDQPTPLPLADHPVGSVPRQFLDLAEQAICHADPARFAVLYRLLWRLQADGQLLQNSADPDNSLLTKWTSAVRRDSHKMKAFVRFKSIVDDSGLERYAAWFEPEHYTLERTAPFFARRFDGMVWAIVTPYRSAYWDGESLAFGPGGKRADVPQDDAVEGDWKTYFSSIFNPARLKVSMMKSEMPVKYWRNLPEAELIAPLIRGARQMEAEMIERTASQPPSRHLRQQAREVEGAEDVGEIASLADARAAVQGCRRCPLYEHATQAVFGEGPEHAEVMFVGEQPGDQEDLAGKPFVGPAGQVLDRAVEKLGIDRSRVYVTNAVKHFKFEPRGKRRIHQRPDGGEIQACKFWLNLEIGLVKPKVIVALGATAAQSLLGKSVTISKLRGTPIALADGTTLFVTNHPSYLLRIPDVEGKAREQAKFEADLLLVREAIAGLRKTH
ncbi:UdgX family uracil-DNA binding protein [Devosia oryziradicis]|uniref:Type-4 uracil-DNA glycosylase n=1 Tax=Devosia oryziradicis TaxID=2801335 RepID=A0ABX7C3L7_9HYPH|nr:UdgX family uracil-DNA binding protein [Devosia oryziradicis]QQR37255.1 UdgX family uracil-DNA binding protein [Devosia oryziradicis]